MIYLDHAATTPVDPQVLAKMLPYFSEKFGNPSSIYQFGQENRNAIDKSRQIIAKVLQSKPEEIFFTGSGTEANNWALFGIMEAYSSSSNKQNGSQKQLITTMIEHDSVIKTAEELKRRGFPVTFLPVDQYGHVSAKDLENALKTPTALVSIMLANNEIGTIEHVQRLAEITHNNGALFHTDACQAAGAVSLDTQTLGIDLMSLNAGKIYGPKGVGALYIKSGIKITPLIYGGGQEHRLRAGTENVAGIVGFAEALKLAEEHREAESDRLIKLREKLLNGLKKLIPSLQLNGNPVQRLPNNLNFSIPGIDGESLLLRLDMAGICASSGSACTSASLEPSHVLLGIGLSKDLAKSSLRLTLGRFTTNQEIDQVLEILPEIVQELAKK